MSLNVGFKHRSTKPENGYILKGYFYWVDNEGDPQLWFASTNDENGLILLNEKINAEDIAELGSLISRVGTVETNIESIQSQLEDILEQLQDFTPELDYDIISEKVKDKYLTWKEI